MLRASALKLLCSFLTLKINESPMRQAARNLTDLKDLFLCHAEITEITESLMVADA